MYEDLKNRVEKLESRIGELEDDNFNQKLINTFINILMIFIGLTFGIIFKKIGLWEIL